MIDAGLLPTPTQNGAAMQSKQQRTPSSAHNQQKRNNGGTNHNNNTDQKARRPQSQNTGMPLVDGTMSDSYAMSTASPRSKKKPSRPLTQAQQYQTKTASAQYTGPKQASGPATPAKEQAYAGPTFHASPAPSSLPVPKFFSKSAPRVNVAGSLQARLDSDRPSDQEQSSPEAGTVSPEPPARSMQQSPLDMFFRADKIERDRIRSAGGIFPPPSRPLSTAMSPPPEAPATEPTKTSGKQMFMQELDGQDVGEVGGTGSSTRPGYHRAVSASGLQFQEGNAMEREQRESYTRSLKDALFNASAAPSGQPYGAELSYPMGQRSPELFAQSPFNRTPSGPSTPGPAPGPDSNYHYGNRNLSPLFQAARSPPHALQQQVPAFVNGPMNDGPQTLQQQQQQQQHADVASISRNFLNQTIRDAALASRHPYHAGGMQQPHLQPHPIMSPPLSPPAQRGMQAPPSGSTASPRTTTTTTTTGPRDIGAMEDDLRRMLKLNVIS